MSRTNADATRQRSQTTQPVLAGDPSFEDDLDMADLTAALAHDETVDADVFPPCTLFLCP